MNIRLAFLLFWFSFLNLVSDESEKINWINQPFQSTSFLKNDGLLGRAFPDLNKEVNFFTECDGYLILIENNKISYYNPYTSKIELSISWKQESNSMLVYEQPAIQKYYFSGKDFSNCEAKGFERLSIKNIFKGIDLKLSLKEGKLKYEWLLENAKYISKIKMYYDGASKISLNSNGNLSYSTESGNFTEYKPVSYYNDQKIETNFIVAGNELQFSSKEKLGNEKLIIDPWIINPALAKPQIFEVDYDDYKNVIIQGSCGTYKVVQINPNGITNWTHTSSFGIIGYNGVEVPGGLTVIRHSGTVLISEGITAYNATSPARVRKLSPSGQTIATVPIHPHVQGISRLEYIKSSNQVFLSCYNADTIIVGQTIITDTNLTITNGPIDVLGVNQGWHATTLMTIDRNGSSAYFLTEKISPANNLFNFQPDTTVANDIFKIPLPLMTPTTFQAETYFDFSIYGNQPYTVTTNFAWGAITSFTDFFHGISSGGNNDLFIFDGQWVKKMDTQNGQLLDSIQVNSQKRRCSGISSDGCNNLYVAASNQINLYDDDLNFKNTSSMPDSVYDLLHDGKCTLYACGRSFVACIDAPPDFNPTIEEINPSNCFSCNGSLKIVSPFNCYEGPLVNYNWNNDPSQTNDSLLNVCPEQIITLKTSYCNISITDTFLLNYSNATDFVIHVSPDSIHLCSGSSLEITGEGAEEFIISPNNNITYQNDSTFIFNGTSATQLTVIGTTVACRDTETINIFIDPVPQASFNLNPIYTIVPAEITVINTSSNASSINWNGPHANFANDSIFTFQETHSGYYTLQLIAQNDFGCTDTATVNYLVELIVEVESPNFFSPNDDQTNDLFTIKTKGIKEGEFFIFDRWGKLIFESKGIGLDWDGKNKEGILVKDGTYFFVIEGLSYDELPVSKKGFFTVLK